MVRVVVSGSGNMGSQVLAALEEAEGLEPVGVVEPILESNTNLDMTDLLVLSDPNEMFAQTNPDVVVDFTNAAFTPTLIEACLAHEVRPVIGTSGQADDFIGSLRNQLDAVSLGGVIAPNFALGAVILMHLAKIAAPHFDAVEVTELHHDGKVDSPSGTAIATAQLMREARGRDFSYRTSDLEALPGARGAELGGVGLHSVRLPGLVAHQEVIFGGKGQTLTLRHDSTGRDSFMPGVVLAVREVMQCEGLVYGLDTLIGLE